MTFEALQHQPELDALVELLRVERISSYLEIGAKFGGSLWAVASALLPRSRIVAVDLPRGTRQWEESRLSLKRCVGELCSAGHDARIIWGDSTAQSVVDRVRELGPYGAVLIDANHTRPFLERDWANYAPLAGIVIFHDISWRRSKFSGVPIEVPEFWSEIRRGGRHVEIRLDPSRKNNGIGVLWR